jgi:transcriptional regulator with XRE-family HTH domain
MRGVSSKKRDPDGALRRLGDAIRSRRAELGKSQEAVAFAGNISVRHFQKIEGGQTNPAVLTMLAIASALNVRVADLLASDRYCERAEFQLESPNSDGSPADGAASRPRSVGAYPTRI